MMLVLLSIKKVFLHSQNKTEPINLLRTSCQFKITKTDNLDLVALRVPQQLRERIREEAGSVDAEGSIFLALMEYGLNELVKNNKRILVSKNHK